MNLNNLTVSTIIALAVALPTGQVLSQELETTVDTKANQTGQNIEQAEENLQGAENTSTTDTSVIDGLQGTDDTATTDTSAVDDVQDTDKTVEITVDKTVDDTEATTLDDVQDTDNTVEPTVDNTVDDTEATTVDNVQDTDNTVEPTVDNIEVEQLEGITTESEEIVDQVVEIDPVVEEKFNWDWLGLLGLLGLFGLTGKNKKTEAAHRDLGLGATIGNNDVNHDVNNTDASNINHNVHK
jgi:hypothetical protein